MRRAPSNEMRSPNRSNRLMPSSMTPSARPGRRAPSWSKRFASDARHPGDTKASPSRRHASRFATEGLINFLLPYLIFSAAQPRIGEFDALLASSVPPILWSLFEFARYRRVDAVSLLVLGGIGEAALGQRALVVRQAVGRFGVS